MEALYPEGSNEGSGFEEANKGPYICDARLASERGFMQEEMRRMKEKQDEMDPAAKAAEDQRKKEKYECEGYTWTETLEEIEIVVKRTVTDAPLVDVSTRQLRIQPDPAAGHVVEGTLHGAIKVDDSTYNVEPTTNDVIVSLTKAIPGVWARLFQ